MLAGHLALFGRRLRRIAHEVGQACEIGLAVQRHRIGLLVGQHVLAERGAERREPLDDLGKPLAFVRRESRALAAVAGVVALQHAPLLGRQAKAVALLMERVEAGEQRLVHPDPGPMRGAARRDVALDRQQRSGRVGADQVPEHVVDALQGAAGILQRDDGVVEGRRLGLRRDLCDLGVVLGEGPLVSRKEVFGRDAPVGRDAERRVPGLKEWIFSSVGRWPGVQAHDRIVPSSRFQNVT